MKGADILRTAPAKYSSEVEYASNAIANDLKSAAQVMFAGLGTRIYYTRYGSFDTHAGELRQHDQLWRSMAEAVGDFWDDVTEHGRDDDTVIFIYSEFGRRVRDNGTGTDHGSGGAAFLIGDSVKGGMYGDYPSPKEENLLEGDLRFNNDFRHTYSALLEDWLGLDAPSIVNGQFEPFDLIANYWTRRRSRAPTRRVRMVSEDLALMAHLIRRAGFGATREELEAYVTKGYEATVEDLLHPRDRGNLPDDVIRRYHVAADEGLNSSVKWLYRMITTRCPLVELSRDPAMIFWLDNNDNHAGAINENYGRELLELFSMGIGSYTEEDVKECARAFTGWTIGNVDYMTAKGLKDSFSPYGRIAWHFEYVPEDHDDGEKTFFGETGRFNGEDVIEIIARQPATARFISRRLFQFFTADDVDDEGEEVVEAMAQSYFDSEYEIRSVMRTLFKSPYFKSEKARFARVKGPVELIVGVARLAGSYREPTLAIDSAELEASYMGQRLLSPPDVAGWNEGEEWLDGGTVMERVNFAARELADVTKPGIRAIIDRLARGNGGVLSPEALVERCLDLVGLRRQSR